MFGTLARTALAVIFFLAISSSPSLAQHVRPHPHDNSALYAAVMDKAKQGDALSQYSIALLYERGQGVQKNYALSNDWLAKAAAQNYSMAQFKLGDHYQYGKGVKVDLPQAAKWYRAAAGQNNYEAQHALGKLYQTGDGVKQNFAEAYFWLTLAGDDKQYAADRDRILPLLKSDQIALVKDRVAKWRKGNRG